MSTTATRFNSNHLYLDLCHSEKTLTNLQRTPGRCHKPWPLMQETVVTYVHPAPNQGETFEMQKHKVKFGHTCD